MVSQLAATSPGMTALLRTGKVKEDPLTAASEPESELQYFHFSIDES